MLPTHTPKQLLTLAQRCRLQGDDRRACRLAEHAHRRGSVPAGLLLGEIWLEQGRRVPARTLAQQLDAGALDDAERVRLVRLLLRLQAWHGVHARLESLPHDLSGQLLRLQVHHTLGQVDEAVAMRESILNTGGGALSWLEGQAEALAGQGDPGMALALVETGLRRAPEHRALQTLHVALLVEAEQPDAAWRALDTWAAQGCAPEEQHRLIAWCVRLGRLEQAEAWVARHCATLPMSPAAWTWRGRLALWRGDLEGARRAARAVIEAGNAPDAERILAAADVLSGNPNAAIARLEHLTMSCPEDDIAWCWYSEALRGVGRFDEAVAAADQAMSQGRRFGVTPRINRFLALHEAALAHEPMDSAEPRWGEEVFAQLRPLKLAVVPHAKKAPLLKEALVRFGGNRSADLTTVCNGRLTAYPRPPDPRAQARRCQKLLASRGLSGTLQAFSTLFDRFPGHPLVHTYRGEVHIWAGQYSAAAEDFRASLAQDDQTRWAWIGLGAVQLMQRDPQAAIDTFEEGVRTTEFAGPTLYIYRAEAWLMLGDRDRAMADLKEALAQKSQRLSAWMHLALLDAQDGNHAPAQVLLDCIEHRLPGLFMETQAETPAQHLTEMFSRMKGNRSSSLITWMTGGRLRMGSWSALPVETCAAFSHWGV